jgi:hypothetical protein
VTLRPALQTILDGLLAESAEKNELGIDAIGEALADLRVDTTEIEALLVALEHAGRRVAVPTGATGIASLKRVLPVTRALAQELGRKPTIDEIATRSDLSVGDVRRALLLAQVMGRGR